MDLSTLSEDKEFVCRVSLSVTYLMESSEDISLIVLLKVKETTDVYLGGTITNAIIFTMPSYFNNL